MTIFEKTRELGQMIQDSEEMKAYKEAEEAQKNDEATQEAMSEFNLNRLNLARDMQNGKINPVSGIFLMKNNMGYEDKTEMVVTPNNPVGADLPEEELRKRIAGDVVIDKDAIEAEYKEI